MTRTLVTAAVLALGAGSAQGAFVSFASDSNSNNWTFTGIGGSVMDAGATPVTLHIDDENGVLGTIKFDLEFNANFQMNFLASFPLGGGAFLHKYGLSGSFSFDDFAGNTLLSATVGGGVLTALGGQNSWGSTAGIQANDQFGAVTYTWFGPPLPAYNLLPGVSIGPDDAAFTLTALNSGIGKGVSLGPDSLPNISWNSEGSFSGTVIIPAPGAGLVLGVAALGLVRRRR